MFRYNVKISNAIDMFDGAFAGVKFGSPTVPKKLFLVSLIKLYEDH